MKLGKHLHAIMAASNDSQELLYVWKGWRDAVGPKVRMLLELLGYIGILDPRRR